MSDKEPLVGPEDDPLIGLQGRIIALELIVRGLLALEATNRSFPLASLRQTKSTLYATLQTLDRPRDETSDAIWSEAIAALDLHFEQVENSVKSSSK